MLRVESLWKFIWMILNLTYAKKCAIIIKIKKVDNVIELCVQRLIRRWIFALCKRNVIEDTEYHFGQVTKSLQL